ncbi:hypothetical protein D9613_000674 [Agrocybe pediades]|uniref:Proteophosphoglycan ppg4 n=1 Tax=Agrocybe pediades TaxID=84607 RepID=A0A8H4VV83_9AGAR|nr:hypothetical protein D9613_000674 [Agrocybe pediades]
MAAALHPLRNDTGSNALYSRSIMNEFDFAGDNRYPALTTRSRSPQPAPPSAASPSWEDANPSERLRSGANYDSSRLSSSWAKSAAEQPSQTDSQYPQRPSSRQEAVSSNADQSQEQPRSSLSYALPPGVSRRVVERYSLDDNGQRPRSSRTSDTKPTITGPVQDAAVPRGQSSLQQSPPAASSQGRTSPMLASNPRAPSVPPATSPESIASPVSQLPSMMPLSASPAYNPPVSPNHRAYAQQPTYVTPSNAPNPIQTVYTPIVPPQEEVCVECAMRDQDMADVDVTSPGVWDRASDVLFEELKQREEEEEAAGVVVDNSTRPRIKGGRLTEQNVKLWLSINPREPASKQQTLHTYVKSQRKLLEAEAEAHARAMQEAKQLDNRMRDAYSQLRRSAYDMGSSTSPTDDLGGVRIRPPISPTTASQPQSHVRSQSREVTLLENGMIVEHVDVRKEEKEARERKRKEEKRARKSSKSSMMDVTSIISAQSNGAFTEPGLKPFSRYSQSSIARPTSVLTAPLDRPDLPRAYSQASFSDVHSLGSASPRRTRFFGMKNLSTGWRSQDSLAPSGMSGSMVDMHVALQREAHGPHPMTTPPIDLNTPRRSQIWPPIELEDVNLSQVFQEDKSMKKKKGGLAKIWRIVTGKNEDSRRRDSGNQTTRNEDDLPLAPPPPLSYLVNRGPADLHASGMRHASTPSLPSIISPKFGVSSPGMSPPTAPSSILPSPASLRASGVDIDIADGRNVNDNDLNGTEDASSKTNGITRKSTIHSNPSELELARTLSANNTTPPPPLPTSTSTNSQLNINAALGQPPSLWSRDKSLPPLPPGEQPARILPSDLRPRTVYTYDARALPPGSGPAHDFLPPQAPFRSVDNRRQSFGGTSSRPNISMQTMPQTRPMGLESSRSFGPLYDEFGISRRSLGKFDYTRDNAPLTTSQTPSKRKSKFGLSSLLGKKNDKRDEAMQENVGHQFPSMGYPYEGQDDLTTTGYATSTSRHSTFSFGQFHPNTRMSVTSRKALEELVQQDAEFVAYRYPSNDQRLDLLR